jgi:RimJ/RimL family protein N-acetyltransferase/predicted GNAT family acetyltransferase
MSHTKRGDTMTSDSKLQIVTNPISGQFEAVRNDTVVGLLAYDKVGNHFDLRHTFVPKALRGQHIANVLVAESLDQIRSAAGTMTPSCTYVAAFVEQHPEYADLVAQNPPRKLPTVLAALPAYQGALSGGALSDTINVYPDSIVSTRLRLRPWRLDDTAEAFEIYGDPRVTKWTRPFISPVKDLDMMRRQLDNWITQSNHVPPPQGRWAMELNDSSTLVGGAQLLELPKQTEPRLVMSWELGAFATGHGLAAEAGHALVHSAFSTDASLSAVYALTHPDNHAAIATLGRIGLHPLPEAEHLHGADLVLYAISRRDVDFSEERRSLSRTD